METSQRAFNELWFLSISIAFASCIMSSTFLLYILNFDVNLTRSEKQGMVVILFALSLVVAYNYREILKKNRSYKNIFHSGNTDDKSNADYILNTSQNSAEEKYLFHSMKKLSELCSKSCSRRYSFPMQSDEKFYFHCKSQIFNSARVGQDNSFKPVQKQPALKTANVMKCEESVEIPTILHDCVKQIGDVVQHAKYLNSVHDGIVEHPKMSEQVSTIQAKELNLCRKFNKKSEVQCSYEQIMKKLDKFINMLNTASILSPENRKDIITGNISAPKTETESCSRALVEGLEISESPLLSEIKETNVSFSPNRTKVAARELILEPFNFERVGAGFSMIKIPKYKDTLFSKINFMGGLNMEKEHMFECFDKPYNPVMQANRPGDSEKQLLSKVPMRRSTSKHPKKRQEPIILKNATTVSKNVAILFLHDQTVGTIIFPKSPKINMSLSVIEGDSAILMTEMKMSEDMPTISLNVPTISIRLPIISVEANVFFRNMY